MPDEYDFEIYATESGKEPFTIWLTSLKDRRTKTSVLLRIQRIRQGNFGDCKSLKDGLHELRIHTDKEYEFTLQRWGQESCCCWVEEANLLKRRI